MTHAGETKRGEESGVGGQFPGGGGVRHHLGLFWPKMQSHPRGPVGNDEVIDLAPSILIN